MKKVFFTFAIVVFSGIFAYSQDIGIDINKFLSLTKNAIEVSTIDDETIGRKSFVLKKHPADPNYALIYTQNYEEEYFFINNRMYFFVKEFRAVENLWKNILTQYGNKYTYTERKNSTPDGSWGGYVITFSNSIEQYDVFIYLPSRNWNTKFKFLPGEALVRIVGRHYEYLREYQEREKIFKNGLGASNPFASLSVPPLADGFLRTRNISVLKRHLQNIEYSYKVYDLGDHDKVHFFEKNSEGLLFKWQFRTSGDNETVDEDIFVIISADSESNKNDIHNLIDVFNGLNENLKIIPEIFFDEYPKDGLPARYIYSGEKLHEEFGLESLDLTISGSNDGKEGQITVHFKY
jgi:hypothetical protein